MGRRLQLQAILKTFTPNVYFQPPTDTEMEYPAIRYTLDDGNTEFAGNLPYLFTPRYQLTLITEDPDDPIFEKLVSLPKCLYDRHLTKDELHHYVFNIFF